MFEGRKGNMEWNLALVFCDRVMPSMKIRKKWTLVIVFLNWNGNFMIEQIMESSHGLTPGDRVSLNEEEDFTEGIVLIAVETPT